MECNKDEAIRAKERAERKLEEKDFAGARKWAEKAQNLFPGLDGISEFLKVIDLYVASERKIAGQMDCYLVLGIKPSASDEELKEQHRVKALAVHPDKNKAPGADGAFRILREAWNILKDKEKRHQYDLWLSRLQNKNPGSAMNSHITTPPQPRNQTQPMHTSATRTPLSAMNSHIPTPPRPRNQTQPMHDPRTSASKTKGTASSRCCTQKNQPPHDQHTSTSNSQPRTSGPQPRNPTSEVRHQAAPGSNPYHTSASSVKQPPGHHPSGQETFWTICNHCMTQFEYPKIFLNIYLRCPHCQQAFRAEVVPPPPARKRRAYRPSPLSSSNPQKDVFAASGVHRSVPASATKPIPTVQQVQPGGANLKRGHEDTTTAAGSGEGSKNNSSALNKTDVPSASNAGSSGPEGESQSKKQHVDGQNVKSGRQGSQVIAGSRVAQRSDGLVNPNGNAEAERVISTGDRVKCRELSESDISKILMQKARTEVHSKLKKWKMAEELESSDKMGGKMHNKMPKVVKDTLKDGVVDNRRMAKTTDGPSSDPSNSIDANPDDTEDMDVPDSDFHKFDEDRIEASFSTDQIWAAYDDDDGMPRYYALIREAKSTEPFELNISWLHSDSTAEFGSLNWTGSGFIKTSGAFQVKRSVVARKLNSFSHPIKWRKGPRGCIQIFPAKGDVWALYKNWSPDWNKHTSDETVHKYDMVRVIEDYSEEKGIVVSPLVKAPGFTAVFHEHLDQNEKRIIPKEEMFRFSHQVPWYLITGQEAENAPKGGLELDPAALPRELLQVTTGVEASASVTKAGNPLEADVVTEPLLTYSRRIKEKKHGE